MMTDVRIDRKLGKIASAYVGLGGYQDCQLGVWFSFSGESLCVSSGLGEWSPKRIERTDSHKWTEADRDAAFARVMRYVDELLAQAKVERVEQLKGIPVEVTFDGNVISSWRVLTEVL